jgi:hypothetical protein
MTLNLALFVIILSAAILSFSVFKWKSRTENEDPEEADHEESDPEEAAEQRAIRRRRAIRERSTQHEQPQSVILEGMYWDTLLGEFCPLSEEIYYRRDLEAYLNEVRDWKEIRERQATEDTLRSKPVPNSPMAQYIKSKSPKKEPKP